MTGQDRPAEPTQQDLSNGAQNEHRAVVEEQPMTIAARGSELNSLQEILAAWMVAASIGLAAVVLL